MAGVTGLSSVPQYMTWQQGYGGVPTPQANAATSSNANDSSGGFDSLLSGLLTTAGNVYSTQNAAEAQNNGILAGIGTQQNTMGNINSLFGTQSSTGNAAFNNLQSYLGLNGQPADFSQFYNSPGYQFSLSQGENAIRSAAAANGSAYTPNTLANIGQYVAGTASQNYNNYIQQLLQTANYGAQANNTLTNANLQTGGTISQLQQNSGTAQAGGQTGVGSAIGSFLGANGSGIINGIGGLLGKAFGGGSSSGASSAGGIGGILNGASSLFGGGQGGGTPYSDYNPVTGQGNYTGNNLFDQFSSNTGYDPTTGQYDPNTSGLNFSQFSQNSGYDPTTGDYSSGLGNLNLGDFSNPS